MECHLTLRGTHIMGVIIGTELLGAERGMIQALFALKEAGARITVGVSGRAEAEEPLDSTAGTLVSTPSPFPLAATSPRNG